METTTTRTKRRAKAKGEAKNDGKNEPDLVNTRERILIAAEELIALRGVDSVELKDIAERVGIRSPSIFAHFNGLEAVVSAVGMRLTERIILSWRPFNFEQSPMARLRSGVRGLVQHFADNPATVRMMLRGMGGPTKTGEARERVDLWRAMVAQPISQLFKAGVRAGEFRKNVRVEGFMAQMLGAIIVNLVFVGWDEHGKLKTSIPISRLQKEAEDLAVGIVSAKADE